MLVNPSSPRWQDGVEMSLQVQNLTATEYFYSPMPNDTILESPDKAEHIVDDLELSSVPLTRSKSKNVQGVHTGEVHYLQEFSRYNIGIQLLHMNCWKVLSLFRTFLLILPVLFPESMPLTLELKENIYGWNSLLLGGCRKGFGLFVATLMSLDSFLRGLQAIPHLVWRSSQNL